MSARSIACCMVIGAAVAGGDDCAARAGHTSSVANNAERIFLVKLLSKWAVEREAFAKELAGEERRCGRRTNAKGSDEAGQKRCRKYVGAYSGVKEGSSCL